MSNLQKQLDELNNRFFLILENYESIYVNYKLYPDAYKSDFDNMNQSITTLHKDLFLFKNQLNNNAKQNNQTIANINNNIQKLKKLQNDYTKELDTQIHIQNANKTKIEEEDVNSLWNTPSDNQIRTIKAVKTDEKNTFTFQILKLIFLLLAVFVIIYLISKMLREPDSSVVTDVKTKTIELGNNAITKISDVKNSL